MKDQTENNQESNKLIDDEGNEININPEVKKDYKDEDLVDKKTLKKYRIHWYQKIPYPVRALLIKYWFFGLNYFLFQNGLGSLSFFREASQDLFALNTFILMIICGLAIGVFNDIFVYNILDTIEDYPGQSKDYVIYKSNKVISLLINTLYGLILGVVSLIICGLLSSLIGTDSFWFREAFSVAVIEFLIDFLIIGIKNIFVKYVFKKREVEDF